MMSLVNVNSEAISWLILVDPFEFPQAEMLEIMRAYPEFRQKLDKSIDLESIARGNDTLEHWFDAAQYYEQAGELNLGAQRLCLVRFFIKFEEGFQ